MAVALCQSTYFSSSDSFGGKILLWLCLSVSVTLLSISFFFLFFFSETGSHGVQTSLELSM